MRSNSFDTRMNRHTLLLGALRVNEKASLFAIINNLFYNGAAWDVGEFSVNLTSHN